MKTNQNTIISGKKVVLVPYRHEHVPRYHEWMKSKELQELTASEPLTLEQEYEMQKSWREDDDKCTFIVLDAEKYRENKCEVDSMVGDVNLFFNDEDDKRSAELEIMVAETYCRRRGLGTEATLGMMKYGCDLLGVNRFIVKIGYSNKQSQNMFQKFNFQEVSRSEVFEEITMENVLHETNLKWLHQQTADLKIEENMESIN